MKPDKKMSKTLIVLLSILGVLILASAAVGGYYYWTTQVNKTKVVTKKSTNSSNVITFTDSQKKYAESQMTGTGTVVSVSDTSIVVNTSGANKTLKLNKDTKISAGAVMTAKKISDLKQNTVVTYTYNINTNTLSDLWWEA